MPTNKFRNHDTNQHKHNIKYNILLLGADNLGKSTFINNLLNKYIFTKNSSLKNKSIIKPDVEEDIKIINPLKTVLYTSGENLLPLSYNENYEQTSTHTPFNVQSIDIKISSKEEELNLTLLKSQGFGQQIDNTQSIKELETFLTDKYDKLLVEETRIQRDPRFVDQRVHVILYFIQNTGHLIKELDIEAMKTLSRYSNILPIVSMADGYTEQELVQFKKNITEQFEDLNVPVFKFSTSDDNDDEYLDEETIKDNEFLQSLQPFSVVTSDEIDTENNYFRTYSWLGSNNKINIDTIENNQLSLLKRVLFGSHLQDFKDILTNFLYESYRSKKLQSSLGGDNGINAEVSMNRGGISESPSFVNLKSSRDSNSIKSEGSEMNVSPSVPSLSNYQQLVINGQPSTYSLSRLAKQSTQGSDLSIDRSADHQTDQQKLRNISQTIPYQLTRDRLKHQKLKLEQIETDSAKELQKKIEDLEKKAMELRKREKLLKQQRLQQEKEEAENNDSEEEIASLQISNEPTNNENIYHDDVVEDDEVNASVIKNEL
ncbi:septin [Hanseniaspora uvarum]|nr:septin [Hanseniaspora uvarum]